ncbi:predicted protein [Nematostella vectensis]|uniref:Uncharacterized protein n=1 Tax=Nematostella vectensis TaxID=45351 RepID=A7RJL5_NEMVE|nr:predicted protein [Nematostella vectensis]|eukprot:XP_001640462.1 predicted protein [Nematostella vectensis]
MTKDDETEVTVICAFCTYNIKSNPDNQTAQDGCQESNNVRSHTILLLKPMFHIIVMVALFSSHNCGGCIVQMDHLGANLLIFKYFGCCMCSLQAFMEKLIDHGDTMLNLSSQFV